MPVPVAFCAQPTERSLSEAEADADNDGKGQAGAVVVDAFETGPGQLIHFRQSAHAPQASLDVEIDAICNREQDAGVDAERERRSPVAQIRVIEHGVCLRCGEPRVDFVYKSESDRGFPVHPEIASGQRRVSSISVIERQALVVGVLRVEARGADIAQAHQVGVGRLVRQDATQFGIVVQRVAVTEAELQARAVHISVRIGEDRY
jgi:hypothetical protein